MQNSLAFLLIGSLLLAIAVTSTALARAFVSSAMVYLGVGWLAGISSATLLHATPSAAPATLELGAELALLISLFSVGLKMGRVPFGDSRWILPVRLAVPSMLVTAATIAMAGWWLFGLDPGYAVLLGGILAPTDPVLAAGVQTEGGREPERLRFGLAGEGGLNDGTAFPIVVLGLGMLGLHDLGAAAWRWWAIDVAWATAAGVAIGGLAGAVMARVIVWLRVRHRQAQGHDEFVALGLIASAYGLALLCHASGFLAVFAAGLALQRGRLRADGSDRHLAAASREANADMTDSVQTFNGQLERVAELAMVLVVGWLLAAMRPTVVACAFALLVLLLLRPFAVVVGTAGLALPARKRAMLGWFGIRGIGSVYYLAYAYGHGIAEPEAALLATVTLTTVATSIVLHGATALPLTRWYARRSPRPGPRSPRDRLA